MTEVRQALEQASKERRSGRNGRVAAICAAVLLCLALGFGLGRFTAPGAGAAQKNSRFSEPLVEAAVRARLALAEDAALTDDDLSQVRELFIYGDQVFPDLDSYNWEVDLSGPVGNIETLDDLALLPNLSELHIGHQTNLDVSAITKAPWLETVELKDEPVKGLASLAQLGEQPYLQHLELRDEALDSLEGVEQAPALRIIDLRNATVGDVSALRDLAHLETVYANAENYDALSRLFEGSGVDVRLE